MGQHCQCKFLLPSFTTTSAATAAATAATTTLHQSSIHTRQRRRRRRRGRRRRVQITTLSQHRVQNHAPGESGSGGGENIGERGEHSRMSQQQNDNDEEEEEEEEEEELEEVYFNSQEQQAEDEDDEEEENEYDNEEQQQRPQLQLLQNQLPYNIQAVVDPNDGSITFFAPVPSASSSSSSSSDEEKEEKEEDDELPAARHHAYLPGVSHPLYPEDWISSPPSGAAPSGGGVGGEAQSSFNLSATGNDDMEDNDDDVEEQIQSIIPPPPPPPSSSSNNNQLLELPILELNSIILFPGSTLPIRLRNPDWISYLGSQIQRAKYNPNNISSRVVVQIGIVTEIKNKRQRRRRIPDVGSRVGRWRTELIRRGGGGGGRRPRMEQGQQQQQAEIQEAGTLQQEEGETQQQQQQQQQQGEEEAQVPSAVVLQQPPEPPPQPPLPAEPEIPVDPLVGRIGTIATITYTHEEDEYNEDASRGRSSSSRRRRNENLLIVTAVGTGRFRILSRIDQDDDDDNNTTQRRRVGYGDMADIRLYMVQDLQTESSIPLPPSFFFKQQQQQQLRSSSVNNTQKRNVHEDIVHNLSLYTGIPSFVYRKSWPWFLVKEIKDILGSEVEWEGLKKSLPSCYGGGSEEMEELENDGYDMVTAAVATLNASAESAAAAGRGSAIDDTPPAIKQSNDNQNNNNNNNNNTAITTSRTDPTSFSYWMASNMPLSEQDKLELLETNCTVKRLQFILQKMKKAKQANKTISCKHCGVEISRVSSMFTVGGAEGTTGAYVNEHGVIHQTLTLREVNMNSVICIGRAETRDSWFPGYSWTITNCSICDSHLGWKFLTVKKRHHRHHHHRSLNNNHHQRSSSSVTTSTEVSEEDQDRPNMFWGLSNASVTTESTSPQRVRHGRFQLQDWLFAPPAHSESEEEFAS